MKKRLALVAGAWLSAGLTMAADPPKGDAKQYQPPVAAPIAPKVDIKQYLPPPQPHVPPKQQPLPTPTPTPKPAPKGPVLVPDTTPKH